MLMDNILARNSKACEKLAYIDYLLTSKTGVLNLVEMWNDQTINCVREELKDIMTEEMKELFL